MIKTGIEIFILFVVFGMGFIAPPESVEATAFLKPH
jgi:hypothetical protein